MTIFRHELFGEIRICQDAQGEPLFCLKDVCEVLGLSSKGVNQRLEDKVISNYPITDTLGRTREVLFVNEDGLYDVILDSRKPEAKAFRKWVTAEVLPQIRKTGGYIKVEAADDEKTIMAKALLVAQRTIEQKNQLLEEQKPQVLFANAVVSADDSILIRDLAKLITQNGVNIGQNRLFYWLRLHGYLFQHENRPIQKWVEQGLFDTNITLVETHHGTKERCTTKVTGKGQHYFVNGFVTGKFTAVNGMF